MERVGQHCALRHKKDLGINVRKCDYCVQNDTHSGPDHLSLDATLSGISLAPASSISPRPLKEKKVISAGAGPWLRGLCFAQSSSSRRARVCLWSGLQETVDSPYLGMINCPEGGTGFNFSCSVNHVPLFPPHTPTKPHPAFQLAFCCHQDFAIFSPKTASGTHLQLKLPIWASAVSGNAYCKSWKATGPQIPEKLCPSLRKKISVQTPLLQSGERKRRWIVLKPQATRMRSKELL